VTAQQLRDELRRVVRINGSQKVTAAALGISPRYLRYFLGQTRNPGPKLLKALRYKRVVLYTRAARKR